MNFRKSVDLTSRVVTVFLYLLTVIFVCESQDGLVTTVSGRIQGVKQDGYFVFYNIPYAKPPVGNLRFAKPVAHPPFEGTFNATKNRKTLCPQATTLPTTEDCLILNVYAKFLPKQGGKVEKKKVLVFIHGGGFVTGSSSLYVPQTFVITHDVIVVTVNYRLGVLGFLSTGDDVIPGNFGLWDVLTALTWVKKNIGGFGGDADDVAISGEAAGAVIVSYLSLSPAANGLFTKVYTEGGAAVSTNKASDSKKGMLIFAKTVNCWKGKVTESVRPSLARTLLQCMRNLPTKSFNQYNIYGSDVRNVFTPRVDNSFLSVTPRELLQDPEYLDSVGFYNRPYLSAFNNEERSLFYNVQKNIKNGIELAMPNSNAAQQRKKFEEFKMLKIKDYIDFRLGRIASNCRFTKIIDFYVIKYGEKAFSQLAADILLVIPIFDTLDAATTNEVTRAPAWLFYFDYFPSFMKGEYKGVGHGLDLAYWFNMPLWELNSLYDLGINGNMTAVDKGVARQLSSIIAHFVKTGDLSTLDTDNIAKPWPPYDPKGSHYLDLNPQSSIKTHLMRETRELWKEVEEQTCGSAAISRIPLMLILFVIIFAFRGVFTM